MHSGGGSGLDRGAASLKVHHRHHPCASTHDLSTPPSLTQTLARDQLQVNSIHDRVRKVERLSEAAAILPTQSPNLNSLYFGTTRYVVSVSVGTNATDLVLIFDTGSDLTWTQCLPCARPGGCYEQVLSIFDPKNSHTYSSTSCNSAACSAMDRVPGPTRNCSSPSSACGYAISYDDSSFSVGYLGKDRLTLPHADAVIDNFTFGCGHYNNGTFGKVSGILGLGPGPLSIVSQTAEKYGKIFSYCLPTQNGNNDGYLKFGRYQDAGKNFSFTPFAKKGNNDTSFYYVQVQSISVAGKKLPVNAMASGNARMIIDPGTTLTHLPPKAYGALKSAFEEAMKTYNTAHAFSVLDNGCFDLSNYAKTKTKINIPTVVFEFSGNVTVGVPKHGTVTVADENYSRVCLAFLANKDRKDVGIYGSMQQQTLEVVYDVAGERLGFSPAGWTEQSIAVNENPFYDEESSNQAQRPLRQDRASARDKRGEEEPAIAPVDSNLEEDDSCDAAPKLTTPATATTDCNPDGVAKNDAAPAPTTDLNGPVADGNPNPILPVSMPSMKEKPVAELGRGRWPGTSSECPFSQLCDPHCCV
ncbi:unnamed protein product [Cuscuta campestris]|uniref:Peptidase A1 domain-containing protein n=1 Tax=Cuscuta campestris TaxID=132261 RepID=A0A484M5R2_9ASTE|nr:unnamed protein product [Cuscuta campestris]